MTLTNAVPRSLILKSERKTSTQATYSQVGETQLFTPHCASLKSRQNLGVLRGVRNGPGRGGSSSGMGEPAASLPNGAATRQLVY